MLVRILLIGLLILCEASYQIKNIFILFMGHSWLYLIEANMTFEQIFSFLHFVVHPFIQSFKSINAFLKMGFEGNCQHIVKTIDMILKIHVLLGFSAWYSVKFICYLSWCFVAKKVILFAIEIYSHKAKFEHIPHILLLCFLAIEVRRLVLTIYCSSWYFVDLDPERVIFLPIFIPHVNAFNSDIHVVEQIQKYFFKIA